MLDLLHVLTVNVFIEDIAFVMICLDFWIHDWYAVKIKLSCYTSVTLRHCSCKI